MLVDFAHLERTSMDGVPDSDVGFVQHPVVDDGKAVSERAGARGDERYVLKA